MTNPFISLTAIEAAMAIDIILAVKANIFKLKEAYYTQKLKEFSVGGHVVVGKKRFSFMCVAIADALHELRNANGMNIDGGMFEQFIESTFTKDSEGREYHTAETHITSTMYGGDVGAAVSCPKYENRVYAWRTDMADTIVELLKEVVRTHATPADAMELTERFLITDKPDGVDGKKRKFTCLAMKQMGRYYGFERCVRTNDYQITQQGHRLVLGGIQYRNCYEDWLRIDCGWTSDEVLQRWQEVQNMRLLGLRFAQMLLKSKEI